MPNEISTLSIQKAKGLLLERVEEDVISEVPLTIQYNGEEIATLMCSPCQTEELAYGFLHNEGFIQIPEDVYNIRHDPSGHMIWVEGKPFNLQEERMSKRFIGKSKASSCSDNNDTKLKPLTSTSCISLQEAYGYINYLQTNSPIYASTRGNHSGGVGYQGKIILMSRDIGRHNVFDKLSGSAFRAGLNLDNHVVFFSGRLYSEFLLKIARMKTPIIIARGAPTDMALSQAAALNITVIGLATEQTLNIYTCPDRIVL
ncbi:MAG: formate dehydrogenase family accessory protein FdhD [Desulfosporosinus sp. BRH_c37]|nr:MAG: formate dehydrogenase family accessory protein FdhD [Desulfosporosinus sp. BRH_c37]